MNVLLDPFGTSVQTKPNSVTEFPEADNLDATKPSMFQGIGEALSDIPGYAAYSSLSSLNSAIAVRTDSLYDMENHEDPFAEDFAFKRPDKETAVKAIEDQAKYYRLKAKNEYMPSAETTGTASMMIHGMGSMILQAVTHTMLTGNPYLGAASFGMDRGFFTRGDLMDKGVDEKTANKAGLAAGVFEGAGMALPGALGSKVLKSMAFGAVVNPATDIGENATIGFILNNADYQKQAREYDPFDPTNLAVSAGMGAFFGALGARTNRRATAILNAEEERTAAPNAGEEGQAAPNTNMNKSVLDSIQNRDRSSKESRLQMEKIASAPNFNLLRESRSLDQGAPIIAYVPEDMNILWGKRVDVSADPSSEPMTMRYAVVDADDVLTSNAVDGSSNPGFTDPTVAGARAIAGNGRIAGLQGAYRQVKATKYRADLTQDAKEFGISKRQLKKMKNPILVRVMDDADVVEGIGEASNRTGTLKLNPAEQAAQDARNVRLEEVEFTKDGEITRKSMDEFVKRTPDKEGLIDSNGNALYDNIARRMRPAIFAAAFSDTRIINRFIADSPEDRKIMNVLQSVATEVVRLKKIKGELDFSPDLLEAVADVFETRREAKKINGKGHEKELTGSLMEESATPAQRYFRDILLSANPERLQEILARFREVAEQESGGAGFFEAVTKDQVFQMVKKEFDSFDRAVNEIRPSHVDAAMELQSARIIQEDQPSGTRGDINKSLADEQRAAEQLDNGEKVEVSGEGVDPEVMDKEVSSFISRFVRELVGAGAEQKVAEMGAKVHDAFFETLGIRLGKSRKELEQEYEVRVQRAESAEGFSQEPISAAEKLRKDAEDWGRFVDDLKLKPTQNVVMLKQTPLVMKLIGAKFLTLRATPHMFDGALPGEKKSSPSHHIHPEISKRVLKQIPEALTDPIAIFRDDRRENTYLFMLDLKAENNQNVVVAVKFNGPGRHAEINLAKTSWGPENTLYFPLQEQNNALVYANSQKISRWNKSSGIYSLRGSNDSGVSVKTEADLVKLRELFPGYYQTSIQDPLITVHNISEENLNKSLDLGGFAVPSLGITKQRTPYADFGEISLIGTRDMVDPSRGTPVFSQDAYTARFPQPDWSKSLNTEKAKPLVKEIMEAKKEVNENGPSGYYYLQYEGDRDKAIKDLLTHASGMYLFIKHKGIPFTPIKQQAKKPSFAAGIVSDFVDNNGLDVSTVEEGSAAHKKISDGVVEALREKLNEPTGLKGLRMRAYGDNIDAYEKTGFIPFKLIEEVKKYEVERKKAEGGDAPVSSGATQLELEKLIAPMRDEFEKFISDKVNSVYSAPLIKVGNSYRPITLQNVVEAMKSSAVSNKESTLFFGPGKVRAAAARRFDSIEDIQGNRDLIADSQTVNGINAAANDKMSDFRDLAARENRGDEFSTPDRAMEALAKVAGQKSKPTPARMKSALKKYGFEPSDETVKLGVEILNDIKKAMTDYFEAKPQRAVGADEFRGAVVPEGTSEATIRRLEQAGITVAKYDAEVEGARAKVIQELTNRLNEKSGDILFQNENAPRGIYTPGERVITLMQSANESTFIHESGHYFLDVLTDVAMKDDAPAQVKADVQTLMDWFGVKDLDEWRNLSIDEQRAAHEQFARGFEQYLREGEAPSTALEKVFKAFKDWLTKIYKSSEELQVEISPEVRAVYDRLLATDEQIRAKEEIDTPSLFGGMEPEEPPANPVVKAVQQTAEQMIDQAPISEDSKARIRETLGINQPEPQTGENHPHYGIPNEERFMDQNLETSAANDPNAFIVLDDGREVSMGDYMREVEAEQRQEFDRANSVSEAAQCMLRNGAFDDVF